MSQTVGILPGTRRTMKSRVWRDAVLRELIIEARREVRTVGDLDVDDVSPVEITDEYAGRASQAGFYLLDRYPEVIQEMQPSELQLFYEQWLAELLPINPEDALVAGETVEIGYCLRGKQGRAIQLDRRGYDGQGGHLPLARTEERPLMMRAPKKQPKHPTNH